jgi:hypothetical protein
MSVNAWLHQLPKSTESQRPLLFNKRMRVHPLSVAGNPLKAMRVVVPVVIILSLGIALFLDMFHVYTIRDDNGGTILWNDNEAYLFMTEERRGYHLTWPSYALAALQQWLNAPPAPSDQKVLFTVIHVTRSGVERHREVLPDSLSIPPHFFTPVGTSIYAFSEGTVYKWNGQRFDPASSEERRKIGGLEHFSSDSDITINGWSKRGVGQVSTDSQFSVAIGEDVALRIIQGNVYRSPTDSPTVLLESSGKPPAEVWHVNGDPQIVSKGTYSSAFPPAP